MAPRLLSCRLLLLAARMPRAVIACWSVCRDACILLVAPVSRYTAAPKPTPSNQTRFAVDWLLNVKPVTLPSVCTRLASAHAMGRDQSMAPAYWADCPRVRYGHSWASRGTEEVLIVSPVVVP